MKEYKNEVVGIKKVIEKKEIVGPQIIDVVRDGFKTFNLGVLKYGFYYIIWSHSINFTNAAYTYCFSSPEHYFYRYAIDNPEHISFQEHRLLKSEVKDLIEKYDFIRRIKSI